MSTVRCPNCRRALHLPEDREVRTARCPLCATEFEVPGGHAPPPTLPVPVATQWVPPTPLPTEPPRREPMSFPSDQEVEPPRVVASRRAVAAAAAWLKAASILGLTQLALCGCCDFAQADRHWRGSAGNAQYVIMVLFARLVALFLIWSGADSFRRRRSPTFSKFAATVAVFLGLYMLYRSLPAWLFLLAAASGRSQPGAEPVYVLYILLHAAVGVPALVGGVKVLVLLGRPDVRELFKG